MARFLSVILFAVVAASLAGDLSAQATWTGTTSTSWYTATNWSPAAVPTSATDVTIPVTANAPSITGTTTAAYCRNLTINSGATLTLNASVGTLYFYTYGNVLINGTLTVTSTGSYSPYFYNTSSTGTLTINGTLQFTGTYYRYWFCYGPTTVAGTVTSTVTNSYLYIYMYADVFTISAGGTVSSASHNYPTYFYHYGSSSTKLPVFTNNGTLAWGNVTNSQYIYFYGDFINNGTCSSPYANLYAYWNTTYGKQNATFSSTTSISVQRLYIYKYQSTTTYGSLTVNANIDVTYSSSTSSCLYHYGGTLTIGSGYTLSCYAYYHATSSYQATLNFASATSVLACRYYFYGYYVTMNNSTGIVRIGSTSYSTAYCYMYSTTINPTGGTFEFVGSTSVIAYVSSSYVGSGTPRFFNVSVGNGTNATTLNMTFSGVCTHRIAGTLTVNANGTFNHSGAGASYPIEFAGNIVNNGTISSSNAANPFVFTGTSTLSGSGALTFPNITINSGATLTSSSGNITVNGNFTNSGTFNNNLGTVTFATATASTLAGNTTFRNLTCTTAGKTLYFTAGSTTTVSGVLTLTGATGSRVILRSTSTSSVWNINDAGTENVSAVDVQDSVATNSINAQGDSLNSGNNTNWVFPDRLTVSATAGTAQTVYANATGGGNGIQVGVFTITATIGAPTLASISIAALGTADDSTAYTGVAIYEDTGGTAGTYDAGVDTPYSSEVSNFGSDNGIVQFSQNLAFTASQSRTFFVVVKLNGPTLATPGQTLNTRVETCTVTGVGFIQGTPSTTMNGITIQAPGFTFADASAASAATAYPASGDYVLQEFTVNYAAGPNNTLTGVTLGAQGSGNDASAYAGLQIYFDTNSNGSYDVGTDTSLNTQSAFSADNGTVTFTLSEAFTAGITRTYFIVAAFNGSPTTGNTFQSRVTGATYGYTGTTTSGTPAPTGYTAGLSITQPAYNITDNSATAQGNAYLGGTDYLMQSFTIAYPSGPTNTLTGITLTAGGTGNDQSHYSAVELYRDANANGAYDVGVDALVASQTSFSSDNGTLTFTLGGADAQFAAGTTRQYFVVVAFNLSGTTNTTFVTQLTGISGTSYGATLSGVPSPAGGPCAGLLLRGNNIDVSFNGPGTASTISSADQGPGNIGLVLLDVTLTTVNLAWTINTMTFTANGSGNDATAFNFLSLYEDSNSSGTFDAADTMAVATAGTAFSANDGNYVATLANTAIGATSSRRFFLVVKMAGTAVTGNTFNAVLDSMTGVAPTGGSMVGLPTSSSTAFIVGAAALSVTLGPASPGAATMEGGALFSYTMAQLRFTAANNNCTVNGVTLTNSGSGSWVTHLQVPGVELFLDDGNGVFDGAPTDTLLFSGAANVPGMNCTFTTPVSVLNAQSEDIWVCVHFAANAGTSIPETYRTAIAAASDVNATGAVTVLGTPAPTSALCSVVLFNVASMSPSYDTMSGGANIVLTGSGFLAPLTLTINGVLCPGTPVININGTQVTGLKVPAGSGTNLVVVLNNGALGAKTLTQTFSYTAGSTIGSGGTSGGGGGGGCSTNDETGALWLAALALAVASSWLTLRRRAAKRLQ